MRTLQPASIRQNSAAKLERNRPAAAAGAAFICVENSGGCFGASDSVGLDGPTSAHYGSTAQLMPCFCGRGFGAQLSTPAARGRSRRHLSPWHRDAGCIWFLAISRCDGDGPRNCADARVVSVAGAALTASTLLPPTYIRVRDNAPPRSVHRLPNSCQARSKFPSRVVNSCLVF